MKRIAKCRCSGRVTHVKKRASPRFGQTLACKTDATGQLVVTIPYAFFANIALQIRPLAIRHRYPPHTFDIADGERVTRWLMGKEVAILYEVMIDPVDEYCCRTVFTARIIGMKEGTDYDYSPLDSGPEAYRNRELELSC